MKKRLIRTLTIIICAALSLTSLSGCTNNGGSSGTGGDGGDGAGDAKTELSVAVLESAYGSDMWQEVCRAYEEVNGSVKITLTAEKNLEDVIGSQMKGGDYPDVVHLATGREAGLTETMIKENALTDISDVFTRKVPGEDGTVRDKLLEGFTETLATNPYGDGKTYLAPMFYAPCGLFYDAGLFAARGWSVPATWDEMWALGDTVKAEGIYLFT